MKKLFAILLCLCLFVPCVAGCSLLSEGGETETTETQTEPREVIDGLNGEGSEENPYLIETAENLILLATITNAQSGASTCKNVYFRLENDLDLGGMEWLPIGGCFSGHFDGNGHTVSNFKMTDATKATQVKVNSNMTVYANIGLFGMVYEGSVSNLTVSGCTLEMTEKSGNYGCLIGGLYNGSVENCRVLASTLRLPAEKGEANVGGLVAISEGSTVKKCESEAVITVNRSVISDSSDMMYVGGLVGMFRADQKSQVAETIDGCKVRATIVAGNTCGSIYVGGIAGYAYEVNHSSFEGKITSASEAQSATGYDSVGGIAGKLTNAEGCSVKGDLVVKNRGYVRAGGLTASLAEGTAKNCSFVGTIDASTQGYDCFAGGMVGELGDDGCVESCLAAGKIQAKAGFAGSACDGNAGGIVGNSGENMTVKNCLSLGSVSAGGSRPSAATITGRRTFGSTKVDSSKHGFYNNCTGMTIGGGAERVAVEGTVATAEQLASASFYTDTLGWSAEAWNIGTPDPANAVYPTVK